MNKKVKNSLNYQWQFDTKPEENNLPSMTVPDQTMSIREIMQRHVRGLSSNVSHTEIWDGEDNDLPDPRTLDLAEKQELIIQAKEEQQRIEKQLQKQEYDKKQKKLEAAKPVATGDTSNPPSLTNNPPGK